MRVRVDRGRMDVGKHSALRLLLICRRPTAGRHSSANYHPTSQDSAEISAFHGGWANMELAGCWFWSVFVTAPLILASKFIQDRCYSNLAWAKLSGLPPREIGRCERALAEWRLWVGNTSASAPTSCLEPRAKAPSCYRTLNAHQIHMRPSSNPYDGVPLFQEERSKVILPRRHNGVQCEGDVFRRRHILGRFL